MKKILMIGLVIFMTGYVSSANADTTVKTLNYNPAPNSDSFLINTTTLYRNDAEIREAIKKYKAKNFAGCISDLKIYTSKDPSSAIAWYYLGNSYMNIAMLQDAYAAYDKVIALNTVPKLTSYAIQAELCMQNKENCQYKDFTKEEIKALKANPTGFLQAYKEKQVAPQKDPRDEEIEKLIKGGYPYNIHPKAKEFIDQEKTRIKQTQINDRA